MNIFERLFGKKTPLTLSAKVFVEERLKTITGCSDIELENSSYVMPSAADIKRGVFHASISDLTRYYLADRFDCGAMAIVFLGRLLAYSHNGWCCGYCNVLDKVGDPHRLVWALSNEYILYLIGAQNEEIRAYTPDIKVIKMRT